MRQRQLDTVAFRTEAAVTLEPEGQGFRSKYPPAEPGALGLEPLEAAGPCCINPHSYSHCAMPPQEPSVLLGHPYLTFW
jgi:hypothetical protein